MSGSRFVLITPVVADAAAFAENLRSACAGGDIAAIILRLAPDHDRDLVKSVKLLAPIGQSAGAAVLVAVAEESDGKGLDLASLSIRGGADGVHAAGVTAAQALRPRLADGRLLGAGDLRSRHDAMEAGEAGADYVMFGEPRLDGSVPPFSAILERVSWWVEIFETPCVAYAAETAQVPDLAATGVEFVAAGDLIWHDPDGPERAVARLLDLIAARIDA